MTKNRGYQVAIIGSGFAGTILARVLARQRLKVVLIEKGQHPRFALGESTTPLANLSLERLAARYRLPDLHRLAAHGRWMDSYPQLHRGLKRGFSFYAHAEGRPYANSADNEARLLVTASPSDRSADSHWLRADVDHHLVRQAIDEGVEYFDHSTVERLEIDDRAVHLGLRRESGFLHVTADYAVDATGRHGALSRLLPIASRSHRIPVDTGLLFGHFEGVSPLREVAPEAHFDDAPYPEHRAAIHHLLNIGWLYHLPFDPHPSRGNVSSVGLVLRTDRLPVHPEQLQLSPEKAFRLLLAEYPSLAAAFARARAVEPVRWVPQIQHRLERAAGPRWFLLPHAYAFFDPLFSTGMAWSLLAVERLGQLFEGAWGDARTYAKLLQQEADQLEQLIESAYLAMDHFPDFSAVASLYFAAASFNEIRQRLVPSDQRPHAWQGFLGAGDPVLASLFVQTRDRLARGRGTGKGGDFPAWARRRIAPRDVIGIDAPPHPGIHPMDLDILLERADRLGIDPQAVFVGLPRLRGE